MALFSALVFRHCTSLQNTKQFLQTKILIICNFQLRVLLLLLFLRKTFSLFLMGMERGGGWWRQAFGIHVRGFFFFGVKTIVIKLRFKKKINIFIFMYKCKCGVCVCLFVYYYGRDSFAAPAASIVTLRGAHSAPGLACDL